MAELDDKLYERIEELSEEGNEFADEERYAQARAKFEEALSLVPAPKTDWEAALWLYASIGDMNFMLGNYKECSDNMLMLPTARTLLPIPLCISVWGKPCTNSATRKERKNIYCVPICLMVKTSSRDRTKSILS